MNVGAIEPKLNWLQRRLNLSDAAVSKMIQTLPGLLYCDVDDNLEPTLSWLQHRLHLDDADVSNMIQKMPTLLGCNIDTNLKPTLEFYIDALENETLALSMVINDPSLFGYSLNNRLKPRLEEAREAGSTIDSALLRRIAKKTKDQWNASILCQTSPV